MSLGAGLVWGAGGQARRVDAFAAREHQGFVWVHLDPSADDPGEPPTLPGLGESGYVHVAYQSDFDATMHATVENILDVPHTAYLHRGLFRGGDPNRIKAIVRRYGDRVEAEFVGEPRPGGILGRILAPGGGVVEHWDRFLLPCVAQVEYKLGTRHLLVNNLVTPIGPFKTRLYATISVKLPPFLSFIRWLVMPFALRVVRQDADILKLQTEATQRFGGEQFVSTDVDVLGGHILRLMRQSERGEIKADAEVVVKTVELLA